MSKRIVIIAGENSGDTHAANVMREMLALAPGTKFLGLGGPRMREVGGPGIEDWVETAAVVGITDVLARLGYFKQRMNACLEAVAEEKPDAVILIDYPGFNLRLAKAIRQQKIATRILYYISPQVWAWKKGRIKVMAEVLDLMVCIFPFEKPLYESSGLRTEFAGHPMVDRLVTLRRPWQREPGLVGWFPGSRLTEVRRHFPTMMLVAKYIKAAMPNARFAVSAANEALAGEMRAMADAAGMPEAKMWIETGAVYDLMQRAQVGAVASGTATLEAACFGLPYALIYRVSWPTYVIGKALVRIKHLGIINVLAGHEVVQEFIQHRFNPKLLGEALLELLREAHKRDALQKDLAAVVATLGVGGAYQRTAKILLEAV
jgi:lipid-A-disaccharide synthase